MKTYNKNYLYIQNSSTKEEDEEKIKEDEDESEIFTCEICIEPGANKKFNNNNKCSHPFCTDCIIKYIQVKLEQHESNIGCPALNCNQFLDHLDCRSLITHHLFDKWCDNLFDSAVLKFDHWVYCPNRECSELIVDECDRGGVLKAGCPKCKKLFCFKCVVPWQRGHGCLENRVRERNDVAFRALVEKERWRRCPRCRHFVERTGGCSFIHCRCRTTFCYVCGKMVSGDGRHLCLDSRTRNRMCCCLLCLILLFFSLFLAFYFVRRLYDSHH